MRQKLRDVEQRRSCLFGATLGINQDLLLTAVRADSCHFCGSTEDVRDRTWIRSGSSNHPTHFTTSPPSKLTYMYNKNVIQNYQIGIKLGCDIQL